MPFALAATPRKILPPPITTPTSTPRARISAISAGMLEVTLGSMPNCCSPMSASPDSFRRMRLYSGGGDMSGENYSPESDEESGRRVWESDESRIKESNEESRSRRESVRVGRVGQNRVSRSESSESLKQ